MPVKKHTYFYLSPDSPSIRFPFAKNLGFLEQVIKVKILGGSGSGEVGEPHSSNLANGNSANSNKKAKTVPDESIPDLIKLIHANVNNKLFLAKEFVEFWKKKTDPNSDGSGMKLPQSKVISKIQEIADYQKAGVLMNKGCWIVKQDWLSKYQIDKVDVPNTWEYLLEVPSRITQTPGKTSNYF